MVHTLYALSAGTNGAQKRKLDPSGVGLTGGCEASDMGVRNQTHVIYNSGTCSEPQAVPPTPYRLLVYYFLYALLSNILFYTFVLFIYLIFWGVFNWDLL